MSLIAQVFTQAANFASAVSGGVDPRTGLFGVRISLGQLVGNRNLGPSLPLELSYSPLTRTDMGFGQGVSLGLTTYDTENRSLSLSTREQYVVQESDTRVVLLQNKLDTVRVYRDAGESGGSYRVVYKSGSVEILTGPGNAFSLKMPTAVLTPAGHQVTLTWDFITGPLPRLKEIRDENGVVLLGVDYAGTSKVALRVLPGQAESHSIELHLRNGLLGGVRHFGAGLDEPLLWDFARTSMGEWGEWVTGVTMPGGMSETAYYRTDGHQFPAAADLPPLPCVYRFVQVPGGGQPAVEASYSYTDTNFVGGYSYEDWDADRDNVYDILTDYSYGSAETRTCGEQTTRTVRTYNRFHLQTEETTQQNGFSHRVVTEYYAKAGRVFADQLPYFQLPKTRTVTWKDPNGSRPSEVTSTEFDGSGNPTKQTDPDGAVTERTYYDPKGEDGCPPDPNGFTRLLKTVTRTPAQGTAFAAPTYTTAYRYKKYDPTPDPRVRYAVLKSQERQSADGQLLKEETFGYGTSAAEFGRLTTQVTTEYPSDGSNTSYSMIQTFEFSVDSDALVQKHALTSHDNLKVARSQKRSRLTGRLWSSTDAQGTTVDMAYDGLGRMVSRTANPGTDFKAQEIWKYQIGDSKAPFTITATDAMRNQVRETLDGLGRPIKRERKDADGDGAWHTVQEIAYDEQGRTTKVSTLDQATTGQIEVTRTLSYDNWGQLETTVHNDGATELTRTDPVRLTTTTQLLAGTTAVTGTAVTTYNLRGEAVSVKRRDRQNNSAGRRTLARDGLGRLRSATDERGHTTTYEYDARGRLTLTTLPDPEHTQISRVYERSSPDALITQIGVGKAVYGTQTFDGLARLTATTSGGRTWKYGYKTDAATLPASATVPGKQDLAYQYVPQLGDTLQQVQSKSPAGQLTQQFSHHKTTGWLTAATDGSVTIARNYFTSGLLGTETTRMPGHSELTTQWTYTVGGLEQSYTWADKKTTQAIAYDTRGRLKTVTDPAMDAQPSYDNASRVNGWTAKAKDSQEHAMVTELERDDFGRETRRTVKDNQNTLWTLTQTWLDNDLLEQRTLSRNNTKLREESFTYDERNRLTLYTCDGAEEALPRDEHGKTITKQKFTYDQYGNITTCRSTLHDGSGVTANYHFADTDPCQLIRIDYEDSSYPARTLSYDDAGRLTLDETGYELTYDALGRLSAAGSASGYTYDPLDRLLTQQAGGTTAVLTYRKQTLASVTDGDRRTRILRLGQTCVAQHREGTPSETRLLATDGKQTVLAASTDQKCEEYAYTPYGHRTPDKASSVLGYDGQWTDPALGWLHLGNGYRAYNPTLMRFTTPDSASPFGAGGINPYAYCLGDPINRTDPTGHLSWQAWLGIGLGIAALALTVVTAGASIAAYGGVMAAVSAASVTELAVGALGVVSDVTSVVGNALEEASPKASSILGWVSLGTGFAGSAVGGASSVGKSLTRLHATEAPPRGRVGAVGTFEERIEHPAPPKEVLNEAPAASGRTREDFLDPEKVYFSQTTISRPKPELIKGMLNGELPPIEVVPYRGKLVSLDNRRLYVAREFNAGSSQRGQTFLINSILRHPDEALPKSMIGRFGPNARTYRDAVEFRITMQLEDLNPFREMPAIGSRPTLSSTTKGWNPGLSDLFGGV